jgi:2'-5' RNA ligase
MRRLIIAHILSGYAAMEVDALRHQYDPRTAAAMEAHVTLAGPVDTDVPLLEIEAVVRQCAAEAESCDLVIEGATTFLPTTSTAYLPVGPTDRLVALHDLLLGRLGWTEEYHYVPHVTVAEHLSPAQTEAVVKQLATVHIFVCDRLDSIALLEKSSTGKWASMVTCRLRSHRAAA